MYYSDPVNSLLFRYLLSSLKALILILFLVGIFIFLIVKGIVEIDVRLPKDNSYKQGQSESYEYLNKAPDEFKLKNLVLS